MICLDPQPCSAPFNMTHALFEVFLCNSISNVLASACNVSLCQTKCMVWWSASRSCGAQLSPVDCSLCSIHRLGCQNVASIAMHRGTTGLGYRLLLPVSCQLREKGDITAERVHALLRKSSSPADRDAHMSPQRRGQRGPNIDGAPLSQWHILYSKAEARPKQEFGIKANLASDCELHMQLHCCTHL
jgi:hypothetical protein